MIKDETNSFDIEVDFSSEDSKGQIGSIESFLDDEDLLDNPELKDESKNGYGEDIPIDDEGDDTPEEEEDDTPIIDEESSEEGGEEGEEGGEDEGDDTPEEDKSTEESSLNYKSIITKLVESKLWDGIDAFETEEGEQISFEDMDIDEDTFIEIFKQKTQEEKTKALENKVSTDGISDFTQKLIEIEKNGGDVQQALESYQRFKNPIEGLDLSKESDQQAALYLKYQSKGLEDSEIVRIIQGFKSEGVLEEKAVEAKTQIETAFTKQMEAINQQAVERKTQQKEAIKKYRNTLGEELKQFQLNESYKRKLLDLATKEGKDGRFELDNLYSELRKDPAKAAELVLFLTNKEEYLKQVTEVVRRQDKLDTMKTIKLVKKGKSSNVTIKPKEDKSKNKNFIDLEEIVN